MSKSTRHDRVGLYLSPEARDRLNRFIAEYRLATGRFLSQGRAIELLLDMHAMRAPVTKHPERELA